MFAGDWWREDVIYQAYPRSFQDSNGDGIGDLCGVIDRLDYLPWQPISGDLSTVDRLIAEAAKREIAIALDNLPNHSRDRHPWFIDARSSRSAQHRDWYVSAGPKPDGSPPNNWLSASGGPAWTLETNTGDGGLSLDPWEGAICSSAST
jgi:glycosidase